VETRSGGGFGFVGQKSDGAVWTTRNALLRTPAVLSPPAPRLRVPPDSPAVMRPAQLAPAAVLLRAPAGRLAVRASRASCARRSARPPLPAPQRAAGLCRSSQSQSSDEAGTSETARRRRAADGGAPAGLLGSAPLASASLITRIWGDRPQNDGPINYAQFMEYLVNKRVLRMLIYDNGKTAIGTRAGGWCEAVANPALGRRRPRVANLSVPALRTRLARVA